MGAADEPERIERVGERALKVRWGDGHESLYAWDLLRSSCPCAVCREERPAAAAEEMPQPGSAAAGIRPEEIQPVGRYAMVVRWSDGHATGIFSYDYLRSICPCEACRPSQMTEG